MRVYFQADTRRTTPYATALGFNRRAADLFKRLEIRIEHDPYTRVLWKEMEAHDPLPIGIDQQIERNNEQRPTACLSG